MTTSKAISATFGRYIYRSTRPGKYRYNNGNALTCPRPRHRAEPRPQPKRHYSAQNPSSDPRLRALNPVIKDAYAQIKAQYEAPKHPIVLAHGLLGFDELHLAGPYVPGIQYWHGIVGALEARGIEVFTASVPSTGSIEERAAALRDGIRSKAAGRDVNIIAGLDARYMISQLPPSDPRILSLTTIATPHRGSAAADDFMRLFSYPPLRPLRPFLATTAFPQLTRPHMAQTFNPSVPDSRATRYFSFGAACQPGLLSPFRRSHRVIAKVEGQNDGLVSVDSAMWGQYKGTLEDVNHLEVINWGNRISWGVRQMLGERRGFNALAFYLGVADMLAKEGL